MRYDQIQYISSSSENERMSLEIQWLEDGFPCEIVPFLGGRVSFWWCTQLEINRVAIDIVAFH